MNFTITSDYRKLKSNETLRKGDLYYQLKDVGVNVNCMTSNKPETAGDWSEYRFFRKRVRPLKTVPVVAPKLKSAVIKHDKTVTASKEKKVTVRFVYPNKQCSSYSVRALQLISLDDVYVTGLELGWNMNEDKHTHQFKKYLRSKIPHDRIEIVSFER